MIRPAALPTRIEEALRDGLGLPALTVTAIRAGDTFARAQRGDVDFEGVVALDVTVTDAPGSAQRVLPVIVKVGGGTREVDAYRRFAGRDDTRGSLPAFYGARVAGQETLLVIERIENAILNDTADDVAGWHPSMRWRMIEALAPIHTLGLGQSLDPRWPGQVPDSDQVLADAPRFREFIEVGRRSLPRVVTPQVHALASGLLDTIGDWYPAHDALPRTLIHGDLTPHNLCFRADRTAVIVDWAHARWDTPQRDIADLLVSTLQPGYEQAALWEPAERHRRALGRAAGIELDGDAWQEGLRIQLRLALVSRVARQWSGPATPYLARLTAVSAEILRRTS